MATNAGPQFYMHLTRRGSRYVTHGSGHVSQGSIYEIGPGRLFPKRTLCGLRMSSITKSWPRAMVTKLKSLNLLMAKASLGKLLENPTFFTAFLYIIWMLSLERNCIGCK